MALMQYIRRIIVNWLNLNQSFIDAWNDCEDRLRERHKRLELQFDQKLSELSAKYSLDVVTADAAMAVALQTYKREQQAEFDHRIGLVLDAAITAAEKISRQVAASGDEALKEYVDSCFNALLGITEPATITEIGSD